jgi:hypothetical protein
LPIVRLLHCRWRPLFRWIILAVEATHIRESCCTVVLVLKSQNLPAYALKF